MTRAGASESTRAAVACVASFSATVPSTTLVFTPFCSTSGRISLVATSESVSAVER